MLTDVVELLDHHDVAGLVAGVGQPAEVRDDRVVVDPEVAAGEDGRPMDGDGLDHDHPGPAQRALPVVRDVTVAR